MAKPDHRLSSDRQHDTNVVDRLRFIKRATKLGFTLNAIKTLRSLRLDPTTTCADVKCPTEEKIDDIEAEMRTLQEMKKARVNVTKARSGRGGTSDRPILEAPDKREAS